LDDPGLETRQGQKYVFFKSTRPALGPTQPPIQWVAGSLPGVKWPGRDVYHSPPSTVEVKQYTYTLPVYLHGVDRNKFTFFLFGGGGQKSCDPNCYTASLCLDSVNQFVLVFRIFRLFLLQFNSGWFQQLLDLNVTGRKEFY
jgi:hypothetical protein